MQLKVEFSSAFDPCYDVKSSLILFVLEYLLLLTGLFLGYSIIALPQMVVLYVKSARRILAMYLKTINRSNTIATEVEMDRQNDDAA